MERVSSLSFCLVIASLIYHVALVQDGGDDETDPSHWHRIGREELSRALNRQPINKRAKNVILFVGDGMGVSTVTAARIYQGQRNNRSGEEGLLHFERFPFLAHTKLVQLSEQTRPDPERHIHDTYILLGCYASNKQQQQHIAGTVYTVDKQTPDSAGTATAFVCGVKNNYGTIGVDASVTRYNCSAQAGHEVSSIVDWSLEAATEFVCGVKNNYGTIGVDASVTRYNCSAQAGHEVSSIVDWSLEAGKHVGVVTNTRITHATPAATYAHAADRNWEGDSNMVGVKGTEGCKDIARQLVEDNPGIRVLLGGGRRYFLPDTEPDPETGKFNVNSRQDGRNLIEEWLADKQGKGHQTQYVWNASSFYDVDVANTDFLLGLFSDSHMDYEYVRTATASSVLQEAGEPSLAEMTQTSIRLLSKAQQGYFLFVEGGRIDHGHHSNRAKLSLADTVAFDEAVRAATEMTSPEETLIIVTGDHSHVFVIGGYPSRGNSITGEEDISLASDGLPYTTLLYGNGPGFSFQQGVREDITYIDVEDIYYRQQAAVPLQSETHAGEDVAVYAYGPMAHLFQSTHEQNYIAHVMAYASCVGLYANECAAAIEAENDVTSTAPKIDADVTSGTSEPPWRGEDSKTSATTPTLGDDKDWPRSSASTPGQVPRESQCQGNRGGVVQPDVVLLWCGLCLCLMMSLCSLTVLTFAV